jgi:adenine-specific DNA-methyltransferase
VNEDIFETPSSTPDFQTELAAQFAALVPEAIADGKIDVLKLQELLAQDAAETSERFGLFWPGKQRALRVAQMPTSATLKPEPEKSKDWNTTKNIFIEGDNLEVLKILQKHYHGKIKMIYIDPPYNTGQDFVYSDNFRAGVQQYLDWSGQIGSEGHRTSTNTSSDGRFHSNWLNMMYPRIKLARNLLNDDGIIFVSIDYNEGYHLRSLMNEVFGENAFVGEIYWESKTKSQNTSGAYDKLQPKAELILAYTKKTKRRFNLVSTGKRNYPEIDERGQFRLSIIEEMSRDGIRGRDSMVFPILGIAPRAGMQWKIGLEKVTEYEERGDLLIVSGKPAIKVRPEDERGDVTKPFWGFFPKEIGTAESAKKELTQLVGAHGFETVKPVALIKQLIFHSTSGDDLILDFFAGSGTTGQAVWEQNAEDGSDRRFILVQIPELISDANPGAKLGLKTISDLTKLRLNRAAEKVRLDLDGRLDTCNSVPDMGFRSYRLDSSSFAKWRIASDIRPEDLEVQLFNLKVSAHDHGNDQDLLTEILLKQGHSLTEEISLRNIAGLEVFSIEEGVVVAYLNEHIKPSIEALRDVIATEPAKFIILEDCFSGDDQLKTNLTQLCKSKNIEMWTA